MTPTIPIPTDHVYKFHALCGLAILVSALISFVYVYERYKERRKNQSLELGILNRKENPSQEEEAKKDSLKRKLQVDQFNEYTFIVLLGGIGGIGCILMAAGFIPWHTKVQPNHDKLLKLQIKKLKREILVLDKELAETPPGPADA